MKAFSKSFGLSEASTCFAISTKRLWRSASESLGFGTVLRFILGFLPPFRDPQARTSKDSHSKQGAPDVAIGTVHIVGDQSAHNGASEQTTNPQGYNSQQDDFPLCRWYLEAVDELLRGKVLHQSSQDELGVVVDRTVGQIGDLPLRSDDDAVRLVSIERPLLDEGFDEAG